MSAYQINGVDDKFRTKRGSILLEALLSVVILSVSITVIIQGMVSSLRASKYSSDYFYALLLLENRAADFSREKVVEKDYEKQEQVSLNNKDYQISFESVPLGEEELMEGMNISIAWKTGKKNSGISFDTYYLLDKTKENIDPGL